MAFCKLQGIRPSDAMGNKHASSSSQEFSKVNFGEDGASKPEGSKQKSQRTRKVLRQTSTASKKPTISKSAITEVADISSRDATEIVLIAKELAEFPDTILAHPNLTFLNLCKNSIAELPSGIGSLTLLTRLYLAGNQLTALPAEVGGLSALEELVLADNPKLASLPDELAACQSLSILNLAKCGFKSVPDCISKMAVRIRRKEFFLSKTTYFYPYFHVFFLNFQLLLG